MREHNPEKIARNANKKSWAGIITAVGTAVTGVYAVQGELGKTDRAWELTLRALEQVAHESEERDKELKRTPGSFGENGRNPDIALVG